MLYGITHPYRIEGAKLRVKSRKSLKFMFKRKSPVCVYRGLIIYELMFYCFAMLSIHLAIWLHCLNSSST